MSIFSTFSYNYFEECPNCRSKKFNNMGKGTNPSNTFHRMIVQCSVCHLFFANPIADRPSMWKYYASYGTTHPRKLEVAEGFRADARQKKDNFSSMAKPLRFLDIGCASGEIMEAFRDEGWEVYGIELSESFVEFAKEKRQLTNIYSCEIEDAPFDNNFFTYINFWHVIEHLRDPIIVLKKIYQWLKPGGKLNLGTPNPLTHYNWFAYRFHGRFDLGSDHTFGFLPVTMKNTLLSIGFEIEEQKLYKPTRTYKSKVKQLINDVGLNNSMQKVVAVKPII